MSERAGGPCVTPGSYLLERYVRTLLVAVELTDEPGRVIQSIQPRHGLFSRRRSADARLWQAGRQESLHVRSPQSR